MEEVKAAELEYYGEYIPLYINYVEFWNTENRVQLDSDSTFTICQYLGQICSLINKDFRNRWTKFVGLSVYYDTLAGYDLPKDFLTRVTKLVIVKHDPSLKLHSLKNLREVYFDSKGSWYRQQSVLKDKPDVLVNFCHVNKISIDSKLVKYISRLGSEILERLTIVHDYVEMRYQDFLERSETYGANIINYKLECNPRWKKHDIYLKFRDLVSVYCFLRSEHIEKNKEIANLKIVVIISADIIAVEYYRNVMRKLYNNIGVQITAKILGRPLPGYAFNPFVTNKNTEIEINKFIVDMDVENDYRNFDRLCDISFYNSESENNDKLHEYLVSSAKKQDWAEEFEKNNELLISTFDS